MKERKADRQLVNNIKAHIRAACTELRRSGNVLARTRFGNDVETTRNIMLAQTENTGYTGIAFYTVPENRRLHDTARVTFHYQGVNGGDDKQVYTTIADALRRRNLDIKWVKTGIRVLGFTRLEQVAIAQQQESVEEAPTQHETVGTPGN